MTPKFTALLFFAIALTGCAHRIAAPAPTAPATPVSETPFSETPEGRRSLELINRSLEQDERNFRKSQ